MNLKVSLLFFFTVLILCSCNESDETSNREVPAEDTIPTDTIQENILNYSSAFQKLIKTNKGAFRGVRLGLNKEEVRKTETKYEDSQLQEEGISYLDYMVNYGSLEHADLRYRLNERANVESIEINIYPNSKASQDSLFAEFYNYFTKVYGSSSQINADFFKWEQKKSDLLIQMQKRGTQKVHDINITFSYLTRESAGILYESY
jgi:hypothetical protein